MRIVQIIDSLEIGGAERMAVNYANVLSHKIEFSALIATRKEGLLKDKIHKKVSYLFLNKKGKIDLSSVFRLRKFVKANNVSHIHAHSSSFFISVLLKFTLPKLKIIWHDHYGISQDLASRKNIVLKLSSYFFTGIIAVNSALKEWAKAYLLNSKVVYFPNFIDFSTDNPERIELMGNQGKRLICVANLRPQKNHELLLKAASIVISKYPDWSFHLFGKDFEDIYSLKIKNLIKDLKLGQNVFLYGSTNSITSALDQCDIAILTSLSEGLPLALLEYGKHSLPVIATNVGEIDKIITSENEGVLIESNNVKELINAIDKLIVHVIYRNQIATALHKKIQMEYSENNIAEQYLIWVQSLTNFDKKVSK